MSHHQSHQPQNTQDKKAEYQAQHYYRFHTPAKYNTTVATIKETKSKCALIDSVATHHFFHSTLSFITYQSLPEERVNSASGVSVIVGKGQVCLPIDGGVYVEAFHTPNFAQNVISVGLLMNDFNVSNTKDEPA